MSEKPWQVAPLPPNESARLEKLRAYNILDTPPESVFDRLTSLAARHFNMPVALVSLVDQNRQWFKARYGIDATETPRDIAFCAHAILDNDVMVIRDATQDPRFAQNPLVTEAPDIRFYAGAPLATHSGHNIGTLCIIDRKPHPEFTEEQKQALADLAAIAIDEMELRIAAQQAQHDIEALKEAHAAMEEARQKAESSTKEKSLFVATISHELRTPMNGILGMAYLLNDTPLNDMQREYVETITPRKIFCF